MRMMNQGKPGGTMHVASSLPPELLLRPSPGQPTSRHATRMAARKNITDERRKTKRRGPFSIGQRNRRETSMDRFGTVHTSAHHPIVHGPFLRTARNRPVATRNRPVSRAFRLSPESFHNTVFDSVVRPLRLFNPPEFCQISTPLWTG